MSFVHLDVNSAYSLLSSTATIEELIAKAKEQQYKAIALTDKNVMYGTIPFYKQCLKNNIKPIIGLTIDVVQNINEEQLIFPLILLAKNNDGYKNLLKITSAIQTKAQKGLPFKWLQQYTTGIYCLMPIKDSFIDALIIEKNFEQAKNEARLLKQIFEEDSFYFALQKQYSAEKTSLIKEIASEISVSFVATNTVKYVNREDLFAYECIKSVKTNGKLLKEKIMQESFQTDRTEGENKDNQHYLKSQQEISELFSGDEEAIHNTVKIAENCHVKLNFDQYHLPKYPIETNVSASQYLQTLCEKGLIERYGESADEYRQRLNYELEVINKMGFSDYFLIVWDFMKYAREHNILTGPGRGSAAGSIVAYVLHITNVDPIKYGLLFERFLNPERVSLPDIDIDFPDHRRDDVINYVARKYGTVRVAQIITFGTFGAKASVRDVGRVFGLERIQLDNLSKMIPSDIGITLRDAYNKSTELQQFIARSPENKLLFETACRLEGLPRHTSTHAAGVIISNEPLVEIVPLQLGQSDVYLTQFSMDYLEQLGLLKMDFLGLRNLTLLETVIANINDNKSTKFDINKIPLNDKKTFDLLSSGETSGIFQLESEGMQRVLTRLKPSVFEDIVAVNALYRPGPMDNITTFIERKHNRQITTYPHPDLESILKNTHGVIVYQEQIMQIAALMAKFTLGEADLLRKAVSKKQADILEKERRHFVEGATNNGYSEEVATEIYNLIVKFANYGFNRSHAVAYSLIAYQLAFLKANYPLQFSTAILTSAIGNDRKISQYVNQLKDLGYEVLPPSINRSRYSFYVENNNVRYSIAAIKGVGKVALQEIFKARRSGFFKDMFDFCIRVPTKVVNRKIIEALIHSGCFDEFGKDRATLLATLDTAIEHAQLLQPVNNNESLFNNDLLSIKPKYVEVENIKIVDKLRFEKEVLGLYLSDHPLGSYKKELELLELKPMSRMMQNKEQMLAVFITEVKQTRTRQGQLMAFVKISDESSELNGVVFPQLYRNVATILKEGELAFISGKLETRYGKKQIVIEKFYNFEQIITQLNQRLYIKISEENNVTEKTKELYKIIKNSNGHTPVIIHYDIEKRTTRLAQQYWIKPTEELVEQLKDLLGKDNIVLKK